MREPKVSVIMAIYNCQSTLPAAIDSIINQTYTNWELIMCDDGSKDDTYKIAKEYQQKYPDKITLIKNSQNQKLPKTLNRCLEYVTGEYTARMDGDDVSHLQRFEKQVEFLSRHPEIDVVGTGMIAFDGKEIIGYRGVSLVPSTKCIGIGTPFNHATIMMKTGVYKDLEGYSTQPYVIRCEDVDLWMRLFAKGYSGANIDEGLYYVREDINTRKRRKVADGFRLSKMLWINFRKFDYPVSQYVYIIKPIISVFIPEKIKHCYHKIKWKRNWHIQN